MARTPSLTKATKTTRELAQELGLTITAWAHVEDALVKLLAVLLGCSDQKAALVWYAVVAFDAKLDMIDALMTDEGVAPQLAAEWPKSRDYIRSCARTRNKLAHSEMVIYCGPKRRSVAPSEGEARLMPHMRDIARQIKTQPHGVPARDVHAARLSFEDLAGAIRERTEFLAGRAPWQDKFCMPMRCSRADESSQSDT